MQRITTEMLPLFNLLEVGISLLTWDPDSLDNIKWVFVNDFRCAMTGFTREEIVSKPIEVRSSREARQIYQTYKERISQEGFYSCETTLLHKDLSAVPVTLHMKLVEMDGRVHLLSELHDIREFKKTEEKLLLSRQSTREMLTLIEREKETITGNIQDNLGRVLHPLLDQLQISATEPQKAVLGVIRKRLGDVCREAGVPVAAGGFGLNLTKRQILICEMIRDGMTSKEIAAALDCSVSTINNHRQNIRRKLKLSGGGASLQVVFNAGRGQG
jgi:PAS domain S-box-containing protein